MTTMKLYTTVAQIDQACLRFHRVGNMLQTEAHKIACSVLAHVGEHGDIRVVAKFLNSFPDMARVNAVRAWFEAFGPVAFDKNAPTFVKGKATKLGEAMDTPFWKFKPEAEYKAVDVDAALESLIKKLKVDAEKLGIDHTATINGLRQVRVARAAQPVVVATVQ